LKQYQRVGMATHMLKKQIHKVMRELSLKDVLSAKSLSQTHLIVLFLSKIHVSRRPRQTSTCHKDSWIFKPSNCPKSSINTLNQPTCYVLDYFSQSLPCRVFTLSFLSKDLWVCIYSVLSQSFFHFAQELNPHLTHVSLGLTCPFSPPK
jgi:hypothetical protein